VTNKIRAFHLIAPVGFTVFLAGCGASLRQEVGITQPLSSPGALVIDAQANVFTTSTQERASLDLTDRGSVVVAWDSRRQDGGQYGVYARVLNGRGEPLTPEVRVHDYTLNAQSHAAVAATGDGAWIAWVSVGQDGDQGSIIARRFDGALMPITREIGVNDSRQGHQSAPSIAANARGDALVTWMSDHEDGGSRVMARLLSADGAAGSDEVELTTLEDARGSLPAVAALPDGRFVAAWSRADETGVPRAIVARVLEANGAAVGDAFIVSAEAGGHVEPSIDADAAGNVVVAWMTADASGDYRVAVRRLDAQARPVGGTIIIDDPAAEWMSGVSVAACDDGRAAVSWNRAANAGGECDVVMQIIDRHGALIDAAVSAHVAASGSQRLQIASNARRSAWRAGMPLALAWSGDAGGGDDSAANVSLHVPRGFIAEAPRPDPGTTLAAAHDAGSFHAPIPPTFDPDWKPLPPYHGFGGDGPDFGFLGVDFTGWTPPDPELAVGPNHLVAMTNGAIAFYDKAGTLLFQDEIEDSFGFWGAQGATGFVFDPECLYDPHSGRFFAMACERGSNGLSYYLLAVSDDSNPVGTWHKYRIHTPVDNDIDSPNMGIDEDVVYLTADFFGPDKYGILMIEKAPLLSGGSINSRSMTITGASEQSMGIPIHFSTGLPAGYIIQSAETGTPNGITFSEVRFHALQNQLGTPTRVTVDVAVPTYSYPNQPPQQGTSNRPFLFEPRFWSCMEVNGSLWAVHHVNSTRARARWYEFRMNGWPDSGQDPTLRQSGELDYGGGVHTFFPSIAADAEGNAAIVFARSSSTEFISMGRAFRRHDDALGTFRPMEFVKRSTVPYTGAGRWGDYSHVEPDPAEPDVFWGMHEWTNSSNAWRNWIVRIDTFEAATELIDFTVVTGSHIDGDLASLGESDDNRLRIRSGFGRTFIDLHLMQVNIHAVTTVDSPATLSVSVEASINQTAGTAALRLFNYDTGQFDQVGTIAIGSTDVVHAVNGLDATKYVNENGEIEAAIRHVVFVPVFAFQFTSRIDQVVIDVE